MQQGQDPFTGRTGSAPLFLQKIQGLSAYLFPGPGGCDLLQEPFSRLFPPFFDKEKPLPDDLLPDPGKILPGGAGDRDEAFVQRLEKILAAERRQAAADKGGPGQTVGKAQFAEPVPEDDLAVKRCAFKAGAQPPLQATAVEPFFPGRKPFHVAWKEQDLDLETAFTAVAATLNNIGPGLGKVGSIENYAFFTPAAKILLTLLMIIGRLEVMVILCLFVPHFYRRN